MDFLQPRAKPVTDIFTNDMPIDRRKCQRVVPMKVLVLGVGRTGTASNPSSRFKHLGYLDTYRVMSASVENPPNYAMWYDALTAKFCDWPAVAFDRELISTYPGVNVILTDRDIDKWHASTMKTVYWRVTDPELRYLPYIDWASGLYYPMLRKFFDTFFEGTFPTTGKDVYRRHYADICSLVPPENLLEYQIQDGWGPLYEFLGRARSRKRNQRQMLDVALPFTVGMMLVWIGVDLVLCIVY
ncbi:hypothetical protein BGW36DRAFT_401431 [Talaromyces proteolyticus]|uniref:NAD dependent epimerase/dehydratase n=1 Tax=Talaromyces proteolyticus TaxID=1131652 RepID=A0AAD4KFJ3_9EURO|nr:uncharacterized protein BGW36DRAFT_401431 [Talaromyces proteolyticus]KAH8689963.1 hypothetical protein BGW36DRAFT_401431 [Talaromyces proteolyticus]